jgi:hypothetical protein
MLILNQFEFKNMYICSEERIVFIKITQNR